MTNTPKGKRIIPSRTIPAILRDPVKKHARHAGEILWCWNLLNDRLFWIFVCTLEQMSWPRSHEVAHAIWNSFQSDKAQRDMLLEVAKATFSQKLIMDPPTLEWVAIKWLVDRTNELSKHRNDAAHVPIVFSILSDNSFRPTPFSASGRKPAVYRLSQEPTSLIWRRLRGDLVALAGYAQLLTLALRHEASARTLPGRPRLLCVQSTRSKPSKKGRRRRPKSAAAPACIIAFDGWEERVITPSI